MRHLRVPAARRTARSRRALAALFAAALGAGCSTSSHLAEPDPYDIAEGDYLTPKEYEELSKDDAIAYCQELAQEIDIQNDNRMLTEESIRETEAEANELRAGLAAAQAAIAAFEGGAPPESTAPPADGALPTTYRVVPGDWLSKIAQRREIYGNWREWRRIFDANRDRIRDPDLIYPDQVFTIPRDGGPSGSAAPATSGETHVVAPGETLRILAEQAYGTREEWEKIWEANRARIPDPHRIPVGLAVFVP